MRTMRTEDEQKDDARARRAEGGDEQMRRAEDPPEDAAGDEAPQSEPGREIPTKCGGCSVENDPDAKFCKGCGASMATGPMAAEEPPADADDEPPPSSKPIGPHASTARVASTASFAEILGLRPDASMPAQKSAAIDLRQVFDHAAQLTGQRTAGGIVGGLNALAHDAAQSGRLRAERNKALAKDAKRERWALARRLVACGGAERGAVFLDSVSDSGVRTATGLTRVYSEMRLDTLRGLVEGHEKNARPRSPFEADAVAAANAQQNARAGGSLDARIERAKSHPKVIEMANRPGQTVSLDKLAAAFVAENFDLPALGA